MPFTYQDKKLLRTSISFTNVDYHYDYPEGMKLKPGSEMHEKLLTFIMDRVYESHGSMSNRYDSWRAIDQVLTAYIRVDDDEKDLQDLDERRPVSIIFPNSYAILETLLTYMTIAFLNDPIFRYEGVSPEDTIGAILLEQVIRQQCYRLKAGLPLHTGFRNAFAYGLAPIVPYWFKHDGFRTVRGEDGSRYREPRTLFEGNRYSAIDPYRYLPDPNVSVDNMQDGDYVGWYDEETLLSLLNEEAVDGNLFNVKYLQHLTERRSALFKEDQTGRKDKIEQSVLITPDEKVESPVGRYHMYATLIPKEYGLGPSEYPEKWYFSVGGDEIILAAQSLDMDHNLYPLGVMAPESDGYTNTPIARLEVLYGMQHLGDWLLNSHVTNVRKSINNMIVYDPYLLNSDDFNEPDKAGLLVRTRRPAWGRGVEHTFAQLKVDDITRGNVGEASYIADLMKRVGGTNDPMSGVLRQGGPERLTKGEFQGAQAGGFSRLERIARLLSMQGLQDIAYMSASNVQQMMEMNTFVATSGRWQKELLAEYGVDKKRVKVSPYDLLIDYDVMAKDGSIPGGNFNESWIELFRAAIEAREILGEKLDYFRMFKHMARNMGAKNLSEFEKTKVETGTVPDETVMREQEKGNVIPIQEVLRGIS